MPPASRGLFGGQWTWRPLRKARLLCQYAVKARMPDSSEAVPVPLKIRLREYQEECIQAVLSNLGKGHKRLGVSLATGSGKTVIFTRLIERAPTRSENADRTLILAHRQELVEQAARHCTAAYPNKKVEIEMSSMHASGTADITIASVQSIVSGDRISKFDPSSFKLILVDEAHHIVAPSYLKTLDHFGLSKLQDDSPALVGVSATLSRFDGLRLGAALDHVVYHKDYIDMIEEKWLSDVIFTTVQTKADISRVRNGANGDFRPAELSEAVNTDEINEVTVRSWLAKAGNRKSTLAFCVDLAHVSGLANTFRKHGIDARFITGDTPKKDRSARLDAFRNREYPVLVNCGVFTEGTDVPNIDCVLLARPTKSRNLLVQMIGRGMRLHPGKVDCHVIDMVASLATGIVTTPTLFGLDPSELVDEAKIDDLKGLQDRKEAEEQRKQETMKVKSASDADQTGGAPRSVVFTDYSSVFDLIEDRAEERHIRSISPHAWVCVAHERYILTDRDNTYLRIDKSPTDSSYTVVKTMALPAASKARFASPREILKADTFLDAVHGADTYAAKKFIFPYISMNQAWRKREASEGQLAFLNKFRSKEEPFTPATLTKGKAADMITKFKFGARGHFANFEAAKRRGESAQRKVEQAAAMAEREKVSVGPLFSDG